MVFAVSGVTLAGGCAAPKKSGSSPQGPATPSPAQIDAIRDRALAAEADLLARYDAALALPAVAADSTLTARLSAIRAEHASHAAAIRDGYAGSPKSSPAPSGASSSARPAAPTSPTSPAAPADVKSLVAALARAEQDAAGSRTADIVSADGSTAMLLASVAASESGHAALLLGGAA